MTSFQPSSGDASDANNNRNPDGPSNIYENPRFVPGTHVFGFPRTDCSSHHSGHRIHHIQMRHALKHMESGGKELAWILSVNGNSITAESENRRIVGWNHDPDELQAVFDAVQLDPQAVIWWIERYKILTVSSLNSGFALFLNLEDEVMPCRFVDDPHRL